MIPSQTINTKNMRSSTKIISLRSAIACAAPRIPHEREKRSMLHHDALQQKEQQQELQYEQQ